MRNIMAMGIVNPFVVNAILIMIGVLIIIFTFVSARYFTTMKLEKERYERVITGDKRNTKGDEKVKKAKTKKVKKRNVIVKLIDDYVFLGGTFRGLLLRFIIGYLVMVFIYFLLSQNFVLSLILGLFYVVAFYTLLDNNLKKKRMNYIKSFVTALDIISASFQVGNTLEESMKTVSQRDNVDPVVRREFLQLRNALVVGSSMEEALNEFAKRNKFYEEPTMFAIVMQFIAKSGGDNLTPIFDSLIESLNTKKENYSMIEGNLFIYNALFNIVLLATLSITLIGNFIFDGFYEDLGTNVGLIRTLGSVIVTILSVYLFKGFTKKAAEGN